MTKLLFGFFSAFLVIISILPVYGCLPPQHSEVSFLNDTTVGINWHSVNNGTSYQIRFKINGDSVWTHHNTLDTFLVLSALNRNTDYIFQVRSQCVGSIWSEWSSAKNWHTGPCFTPSGLNVTAFTDSSLTVSWNYVAGSSEYVVVYQAVDDSTWSMIRVVGTSTIIRGLNLW